MDAERHYRRAKRFLIDCAVLDETDDQTRIRELCRIQNNIAFCLLKGRRYDEVRRETKDTLYFFPYDPKANLYCGKSLMEHGKITAAISCYKKGLEVKPSCADLNKALQEANKKSEGSSFHLSVPIRLLTSTVNLHLKVIFHKIPIIIGGMLIEIYFFDNYRNVFFPRY